MSFRTVLSCLILAVALFPAEVLRSQEQINAWIFAPAGVEPGSEMQVKIMMSSTQQLGGIDFTLQYNDSLFGFISAEQDSGLNNWEYYATDHDPVANTVRVFTIADIPNGPFHPDSADLHPKGAITTLRFFVAPNWLTPSREEFRFFWSACGDNAVSNTVGDTLIIVRRIYSADGALLWDEPDNINYPDSLRPQFLGVPDSCLIAADLIAFKIDFRHGAAANFFECGDADANSMITISDAVALINFIFAGGAEPNPFEAGDVDCNEVVTISDAVYLINFIFAGGPPPCAAC